jgi:ArsR family transcriptional regulator, arsenate/arsenite/antimonite-responsive transcriptional repressor
MFGTDNHSAKKVRQSEPLLPEESGLTLEEHLAMQQVIGHPTRFRILRTLVANEELSASDLKTAVDVESHNYHYHHDELVDVGLVDKRQRRMAYSQGFYTYYRPTGIGRGILEHGVEELMCRERDFNDVYS